MNAQVLLVDDDIELAGLLRDYLARDGFAVDCAHDGESGASAAISGRYDIVVLDVTMPGPDGVDTWKELARIRPDVRVILSSGYHELEFASRLENLKVEGFLQKPYRLHQLVQMLRRCLEGERAEQPNPE